MAVDKAQLERALNFVNSTGWTLTPHHHKFVIQQAAEEHLKLLDKVDNIKQALKDKENTNGTQNKSS